MDGWFKTGLSIVTSIVQTVEEVAQQQEGNIEWLKSLVTGGDDKKDDKSKSEPEGPSVFLATLSQAHLSEIEVITLSITKVSVCHKCRGHGRIVLTHPCADCDGKGSIKVRRRRIREMSSGYRAEAPRPSSRRSSFIQTSPRSPPQTTLDLLEPPDLDLLKGPSLDTIFKEPSLDLLQQPTLGLRRRASRESIARSVSSRSASQSHRGIPRMTSRDSLRSSSLKPPSIKAGTKRTPPNFRVVKIAQERACDTCHGRGDIFEYIACDTCDGKGRGDGRNEGEKATGSEKSKMKHKTKAKDKDKGKSKEKDKGKAKAKNAKEDRVRSEFDCPACNGSGKETSFKRCNSCGGQGWLPCLDCDMRGYIPVTKGECKSCFGSGKVSGIAVFDVHIYDSAKDGQTMIFSFTKHVFAYKVDAPPSPLIGPQLLPPLDTCTLLSLDFVD